MPSDNAELFARLQRSRFRSRFTLRGADLAYAQSQGLTTLLAHAEDFVRTRLADATPANDGKQTPMKGHPVFIAQHATATCCRKCLNKWHKIPTGRQLSKEEIKTIVAIIETWLSQFNLPTAPIQGTLPFGEVEG